MVIPIELCHEAFRSEGGELAWPKSSLPALIHWLSEHALAILGGEVWVVSEGVIHAGHTLKSGGNAVFCWSSPELAGNETWPSFVQRCAAESNEAVCSMNSEEQIVLTPGAQVYYNLEWVSQDEYAKLNKYRAG